MEIIDRSDAKLIEEYESFVKSHKNGSCMQSLKWHEIKSNWGWDAVISRGGDGKIRGTCLVLVKKIPVLNTTFLYAPRGPVYDFDDRETFLDLFDGIKAVGKKYRSYQFMCDPFSEEGDTDHTEYMKSLGFTVQNDDQTIQVCANYIIRDLDKKTSDDIMKNFDTSYRNQVRRAPKVGVYCKVCGAEALDDFFSLYSETGARDGFAIRNKEYLSRFLSAFAADECRLFMCYVQEDGKEIPLSGAITTCYGTRAFFAYAASATHHRNFYPNHLMQWEMINWAREQGCTIYDFGGIPYYYDKSNPAYGVYHFKKGFGGEVVVYAGEFFYTLRPMMMKITNLGHKLYELRRRISHKKKQEKRTADLEKAAKEREERNRENSEK